MSHRSILATPQPPTDARTRKLWFWCLVLGTSGFLTWMLIGSGDLPPHQGPAPIPNPPAHSSNAPHPSPLGGDDNDLPLVIAIIDTGIDTENFNHLLWKNPFEIENGLDDDGNGLIDDLYGWNTNQDSSDINDEHGHGTHVAGIIASELQIREVLGLETRPIRFMILKYFEERSSGPHTLKASLKAFKYAIDHGAHIINYSGGGLSPSHEEEDLIQEAARKNILLIAAAGNEASNSDQHPFFPADYGSPNILSVGATDDNLGPVPSSNFGRYSVDLTARGQKIESTLPGGERGRMTGTSQATAFVTAAAALIWAQAEERLPNDFLIQQILSSARSYTHLQLRSRSGKQLDLVRAATQRGSQTVFTGAPMRNQPQISGAYFAAEPELHEKQQGVSN